jgi:hypothetical protein
VIDNPEWPCRIIDRFAAAGIGVSIDDYGSGLSSLAYLKRIKRRRAEDRQGLHPVAGRKLARRPAGQVDHRPGPQPGPEGRRRGRRDPTALALLRGMGCDIAQGYLIGKPVALKDLVEKLDGPRRRRRTRRWRPPDPSRPGVQRFLGAETAHEIDDPEDGRHGSQNGRDRAGDHLQALHETRVRSATAAVSAVGMTGMAGGSIPALDRPLATVTL